MNTIEVCLSPALYKYILSEEPIGIAVIDVLRATTSITTAFDYGVSEIIPVATDEDAIKERENGCLIAAEKDGITLDYADFGNSPFNFQNNEVKGKSIAYKTTNGTQTIKMLNPDSRIIISSFLNISTVAEWYIENKLNALLLCSGWKNKFNLEDTLLAGALTEKLLESKNYTTDCDSSHAALDLWLTAKGDLIEYIQKAQHRERLRKLGLDDVLDFCFTQDISKAKPVFDGKKIIDINSKE